MTPINWKNERRKISDIKPAEYNPRSASEKECNDLRNSLDQFNLADPIVINQNGTIIGGHFRVRMLQEKGIDEVDVRVPDRLLTLDEEMRLNLRLNKNGGQFNPDMLANFDEDMLKEVGFDALELDKIFDLAPDRKEQADHLGGRDNHGNEANREAIANDNMSSEAFKEFLQSVCVNLLEFCYGAIYICMSSKEIPSLREAFVSAGGHWSTDIIWVKNAFNMGRADYQQLYEPILYGWKEGQRHYFVDRRDLSNVWEDLREIKTSFKDGYTTIAFQGFKVRIKGEVKDGEVCRGRSKTNIWRYDKPSRSDSHPTMKPVALVCEAIRNSSEREQFVLDTFLGSGTTLMACELENRACLGMELDPVYVQCAIDRWEEFTGKKAVKVTEMDRICIDAIAQHAPEASNA